MDELAVSVGATLEEAKGFYDTATGEYRETFKVPGSFGRLDDSLDVYPDSRYESPKYGEVLNNIELQTDYADQSVFEHDLAHELFHVYQDAAWSEVYGKYLSMRKGNDWAIEALAELAAYEVAFADKKRSAPVAESVNPEQPYDTLDDIHEYSMACYLSYLLRQGNTGFGEMWEHLGGSYSGSIEDALNDSFTKKSLGFVSIRDSYGAFWRDVVGER